MTRHTVSFKYLLLLVKTKMGNLFLSIDSDIYDSKISIQCHNEALEYWVDRSFTSLQNHIQIYDQELLSVFLMTSFICLDRCTYLDSQFSRFLVS